MIVPIHVFRHKRQYNLVKGNGVRAAREWAAIKACPDDHSGSTLGEVMKQAIHPNFVESTVICACGNSFKTMSIKPVLKIDVCSKCHPFFTGQQRILDSAGRVERFRKRFNLGE
jgi:large subunit ribosomal protein L31